MRVESITEFASSGASRAASSFRAVRSQRNWLVRAALLVLIVIVAMPIAFLIMLAIVAAALVISVVIGISAVMRRIGSRFPRHDGRENVRVMRRPNTEP